MSSPPSPARLDHARNLPAEREETQADSTELELAIVATSATADLAAAANADRELGCAV
jgi:hypothetical protein